VNLSILAAAREMPQADALICEGQRLSFAALALRVRARRAQFAALGLQPLSARPLALVVDGSLTMFECLYLCFELGVPLLPLHPRLTKPEREQLIGASSAQLLIDPSQLEPAAKHARDAEPFPRAPEERSLAFVPSSGSTGRPKLVDLSRRAFLALARADAERVPRQSDDRALLCLPLSHVGGLSVVTRALAARRCTVVFRAGGGGLLASLPELAQSLVAERITLLSLVPAVLARLLREVRSALHRRKREESAAKRAVAAQMHREMSETLTAMLLSCELAMSVPNVPSMAAEKIRAIDNLARELRLRLEIN